MGLLIEFFPPVAVAALLVLLELPQLLVLLIGSVSVTILPQSCSPPCVSFAASYKSDQGGVTWSVQSMGPHSAS